MTEERQKAEGRRQKVRIYFPSEKRVILRLRAVNTIS
jgi:hypothetical protein